MIRKPFIEKCGQPLPFLATHLEQRVDRAIDDGEQRGTGLGRKLLARGAREDVVHPQHRAHVERAIEIVSLLKRAQLSDVRGEARFVDRAHVVLAFALEPRAQRDVTPAHLASQRIANVRLPPCEHVRELDGRAEEAVVHRANLDAHAPIAHHAVGRAEPRHAPYHIERRKLRWGNEIVNSRTPI